MKIEFCVLSEFSEFDLEKTFFFQILKKKNCFKIFFKAKEALQKILKQYFLSSKFEKNCFFLVKFRKFGVNAELNFHYYMIFDVCRTTSEEKILKKHLAT